MEDIHGVDVSWLRYSNRDHHQHRQYAPTSPSLSRASDEHYTSSTAPAVQEVSLPAPPTAAMPFAQKQPVKRPPLLSRASPEKNDGAPQPDPKSSSRRNSWISSISSKFSSQNSPAQMTHAQAQGSPATANGTHGPTSSANGALNGIQAANGSGHSGLDPYVPQQPRGSFISNALRRLSSGNQVGSPGKVPLHGGVCPRRVMNVDQNRTRCHVPELDQNKLRRVAFCVDVEIAGGPRYKDEEYAQERRKKRQDRDLKEKGEGEALKNPASVTKEKGEGEALKNPASVTKEKDQADVITVNEMQEKEIVETEDAPHPEGTVLDDDKKELSKKKEKKKRSEAERKERKEKRRRKAEENGCVPLELTRDDDDVSPDPATARSAVAASRPQDRPTIDPLRIYRRCCQLRETPILKRISDQLSAPDACSLVAPGVVTCLDLTGSRLQLSDVVTLSDWLAVVPVKKFLLEDADLNDEKVRVILAGLLAAKIPESSKRRSIKNADDAAKAGDRSGVILKLVLRNNPKIGAEGWKHISLFINMCRSIQAIDVSLIPFPKPLPPPSPQSPDSTIHRKQAKDVGDILLKALSERLGGSCLEELVMAECSLTAPTIRKIIDGVIISGVQRLCLAGNDIDDEGFGHVIHYIKSGVCQGLDLGGNDLGDFVGRLAESLTKDCPLWALSLADCDLNPESLKVLFPALVALPAFRFLDLSHNKDLFAHQTSVCLLRKYIPQWKELKRLHLMDVSLSPEHAIGLAEVLPECSHIAHLNILNNPQISALATATDEESLEEAAALFTSLMVAAKMSRTLICVDVDVPGPDTSKLVQALAKQVVAYCLRNMENFTEIPELQADSKPAQKEIDMPEVILQLVGQSDGVDANFDNTPPAPDADYIVGGTGVVKALSYCLLQKATDIGRRTSSVNGSSTPRSRVEDDEESGKAKAMSSYLLNSARKIRSRLQPALVREARAGNEMDYRRLIFLDQTLQGMIQRFEDEYPDTRLPVPDTASTHSSVPSTSPPTSIVPTLSAPDPDPEHTAPDSEEDDPSRVILRSRHNSDVSLASRALSLEEGRLHRLGHRVRTELINPSRTPSSSTPQAKLSGTMDGNGLPEHLVALRNKLSTFSGEEIRQMTRSVGWERAFERVVDNAEMLKKMRAECPEEFERFRETQVAALRNRNPGERGKEGVGVEGRGERKEEEEKDDCAVRD